MPIYAYRCASCTNEVETFFKMSENRGSIPCKCGCQMSRVPSLPVVERRFAGSESYSQQQGFHPSEVKRARRLFRGHFDSNIRDDGRVVFNSRGEQKAFVKRWEEIETGIEAQAIVNQKMKNTSGCGSQ